MSGLTLGFCKAANKKNHLLMAFIIWTSPTDDL